MITHLEKSEWLDDWYYLEHRGGCPEGTRQEWLDLLAALRRGEGYHDARRIGASLRKDRVDFYSPRNNHGPDDCVSVSLAELPAWLKSADSVLANGEAVAPATPRRIDV
jgi:hypothetical protein